MSRPPEPTTSKASLRSGFLDLATSRGCSGQIPAQPLQSQKAAPSRRAARYSPEGGNGLCGLGICAFHVQSSRTEGQAGPRGKPTIVKHRQNCQDSCLGGGDGGVGGGKGLRSQGLAGTPALLSPATLSASVFSSWKMGSYYSLQGALGD